MFYEPLNRSNEECACLSGFFNIIRKVKYKIFISSLKDRFCSYQASSSNFFSHAIAVRPLTCAQPVTPGSTLWRIRWSSLYSSRYSGSSGLGPTRLMSPFKTFQSCGISSSEVLRRKLPSGRAVLLSLNVRNLISIKILSPNPGRRWQKNGFPFVRNKSRSISITKSGDRRISPVAAKNISKTLFPILK